VQRGCLCPSTSDCTGTGPRGPAVSGIPPFLPAAALTPPPSPSTPSRSAENTTELFHPGLPPDEDNNHSWSVPLKDVGGNEGCNCSASPGGDRGKMSCQLPDDVGEGCADLVNWAHAQQLLARAANTSQPFFVGFGIHKPHLPWGVPERFWDPYEEPGGTAPKFGLPIAAHPQPPTGMPPIAWHAGTWGHFNHSFSPGHPVSDGVARAARQGYFAAVSFADDLVGRALAALDATGKAAETVVLLTADHGWQLGEHGEWCKQTLFDVPPPSTH
jgi:hypothetical protein